MDYFELGFGDRSSIWARRIASENLQMAAPMVQERDHKPSIASFNFVAQSVRIVMRDDEPWFVAVDVCSALTLANPSQAISKLDDDERQVIDFATLHNIDSQYNQQIRNFNPKTVNLINESGLYPLILTSRKPEAKKFKKWITSEVLPAIRKTGRYVAPQAAPQPTLSAEQWQVILAT